jgi:hypothetical protein
MNIYTLCCDPDRERIYCNKLLVDIYMLLAATQLLPRQSYVTTTTNSSKTCVCTMKPPCPMIFGGAGLAWTLAS